MRNAMDSMSDYERLGGEAGLSRIVTAFIDTIRDDTIIGFFFERIDRDTLIEREIEFASQHLGGPHRYSGRPIGRVHRRHPINRGHFHRRLWCLETVLRKHDVDEDIIARWLSHSRGLESVVTDGSDCLD